MSIKTHTKTITRSHRTADILLLDLSSSMKEIITYDDKRLTKGSLLVDTCNRVLNELYMRAMRSNAIRDYYDVAIVGYSGGGIVSLLNGDLNNPFVSITQLDEACASHKWIKFENLTDLEPLTKCESYGASTIVISPRGSTPTHEALTMTYDSIKRWCANEANYDSFPPTVIHISDGHPTDCNLSEMVDAANRIKSLHTNDGEVLMINIHLESQEHSTKLLFPTDDEIAKRADRYVEMMARSSSIIPESIEPIVNEMREQKFSGGYRAFGYNVSAVDLISMVNIGTLSAVVK